MEEVAKEKGVTPAQLALAWLINKKEVASPIVGPTKVEQLEELAVAANLRLKPDDTKRLEEPHRPHPILGHE